MQEFTEKDCMQTEKEVSIQNRVVVLPSKVLPEHYTGQLFFCTNIQKTENPRHSIAHLVSLSTGEAWHCWNRDVVGVLRPELLGEKERLQLSQIRPFGALDLHGHSPEYSGYSFLPDGRYASGVWLANPEEVWSYVMMQKDYQYRILICDRDDFAGLMHDCAKRFTDSELIRKCQKHGVALTEAEIKAPAVIHAKYGAYLAENKYGIQDPEIISAIACHTTGKPDMSTLDKILYIADYIEPRRDKADNLPQMRYLAFQDLDETMYEILKGTLEYLDKKGNTIDPMTLQAYEYFAEAMKQKKANMHI